jgi:TRAP-type mannitol/chloroaromatic compound transport system permease small subunit
MKQPPQTLLKIVKVIDPIGIWSGKLVGWLIIPLIIGLTYEVIARYAFGAPTVWAFDVSYMLNGSLGMLGAAYTLCRKGHIRTDVFYDGWSTRTKGWVDSFSYLFLFFPGILFFFLAASEAAIHSWSILETSDASPWRPALYPFKTVVPVSLLLLFIQGISEFLKSLHAAFTGESI